MGRHRVAECRDAVRVSVYLHTQQRAPAPRPPQPLPRSPLEPLRPCHLPLTQRLASRRAACVQLFITVVDPTFGWTIDDDSWCVHAHGSGRLQRGRTCLQHGHMHPAAMYIYMYSLCSRRIVGMPGRVRGCGGQREGRGALGRRIGDGGGRKGGASCPAVSTQARPRSPAPRRCLCLVGRSARAGG